jgi:hypothetical protein
MANYDIPDEVADRLDTERLDLLKRILAFLEGG